MNLAEKFAYYRNTRRFSGFEFSAQRDYGAIHSAMRRADAPVPLRKRVFGTNQDATAASMANILKQLPLSVDIRQRVKRTKLHTAAATRTSRDTNFRYLHIHPTVFDPVRFQKKMTIGFFHITIDICCRLCGTSQVDGYQCFAGAAFAAEYSHGQAFILHDRESPHEKMSILEVHRPRTRERLAQCPR